jgi:hypothetical protein
MEDIFLTSYIGYIFFFVCLLFYIVVADLYVDRRGKVWLLDINVFAEVTDALLFTWEDLHKRRNCSPASVDAHIDTNVTKSLGFISESGAGEGGGVGLDFRVVDNGEVVRPNPLSSFRVPSDFLEGGLDFADFMQSCASSCAADSDESNSE